MKDKFTHYITERVKFHEVDLLGVCNNAVYFNFFETARLEYMKSLGAIKNIEEIYFGGTHYLMANNYCNYRLPAYYDDELKIYTRISYIKNTSFGFEHIVENAATGELIAEGGGVWVNVDRKTKKPEPLEEKFKTLVRNYEKDLQ